MRAALERLKKRRDFLRVAATRRRFAAPGLILQVAAHMDGERGDSAAERRVGFTVSRKVGGAVVRNRARRRLRAAAEQVLPRHAAPRHDYVLIGRAATPNRPFQALLGDLATALRRTGTFRPAEPGDARDRSA